MSTHFDHVSISKQANVYQDGKCISYNLTFPDGAEKTIGVVLPTTITFAADTAETMEIVAGRCRVSIGPDGAWTDYAGGQRFHVPAQMSFDVEALEPVHYVMHLKAA